MIGQLRKDEVDNQNRYQSGDTMDIRRKVKLEDSDLAKGNLPGQTNSLT